MASNKEELDNSIINETNGGNHENTTWKQNKGLWEAVWKRLHDLEENEEKLIKKINKYENAMELIRQNYHVLDSIIIDREMKDEHIKRLQDY